jgi:hypothetical protein
MWKLEELQSNEFSPMPLAEINGKWVLARPLNYRKQYTSFLDRIKRAWKVFTCEADCFMWPEGQ